MHFELGKVAKVLSPVHEFNAADSVTCNISGLQVEYITVRCHQCPISIRLSLLRLTLIRPFCYSDFFFVFRYITCCYLYRLCYFHDLLYLSV